MLRLVVYNPIKLILAGRWTSVEQCNFPKCRKCDSGELVPLSDFGSQGSAIHYKAWVCTNPSCGFNLKIRNGDVYLNEPIMSGVGGRSRQNS